MKRSIKNLLLALLFIGSSNVLFAQTPPDFSFTDIEGHTWNLYEELSKGNTVLIDFFFTTCGPCQTWTPQIIQLNTDYQNANKKFLVLGISDRDSDAAVAQFESNFGVNYPSGGIDGGGNAIVNLYASTYTFSGFPTYAVVCPDTSITWDVWPLTTGVPEIRNVIDPCVQDATTPSGIFDAQLNDLNISLYPNPVQDQLNINVSGNASDINIEVLNLLGQSTGLNNVIPAGGSILTIENSVLQPGYYLLKMEDEAGNVRMEKFSVL